MNNNNNIVTSVQTSEKLSEVLQDTNESTFYWALSPTMGWILLYALHNGFIDEWGHWLARDEFEKFYPAYTITQLSDVLPNIIGTESLYSLQCARNWSNNRLPKHHVCYWSIGDDYLVSEYSDSLVEAYAKVVLALKGMGIKLEHERS